MRWSDIPFSPPPKLLRQFAVLWLLFFGSSAAWQGMVRGRPVVASALALVALAVGLAGILRPAAARPIFVGWMVLAFPIGWTVSLLLLGIVYFGIFTPMALVFRLTNRDALGLRPGPEKETYWEPHPAPADIRRYFRQF